jgi:hypothetical protein
LEVNENCKGKDTAFVRTVVAATFSNV